MIKKTISYTDYNDREQKEDFYFNLSKGELMLMEISAVDNKTLSLENKLEMIGKARSGIDVANLLEEIVGKAYGVKTPDGSKFEKSAAILSDFRSSGAYSELIYELTVSLATDGKAAGEFINGLIPSKMAEEIKKDARARSEAQMQGYNKPQQASTTVIQQVPELPTEAPVLAEPAQAGPSSVELLNMTTEEFAAYKASQAQVIQ